MEDKDSMKPSALFEEFFNLKGPQKQEELEKVKVQVREDLAMSTDRRAQRKKEFQSSMTGIGLGAALAGGLIGGMGKMFGLDDGKHSFKEYVAAVIDAYMAHIEMQRDEIKSLEKKYQENKEELEQRTQQYDEVVEKLDEQHNEIVNLTAQLTHLAAKKVTKKKGKSPGRPKKKGRGRPKGSKNKKR